MNDSERRLIRFVCDGDMQNAQKAVKIILNSISSKKDEQFKENMFRKLESKREFIELPYNLQHLLIAEDNKTRFSFALCHPTAVCDGQSQTNAVFVKSAKLRSVSLRGMRYRGSVRFRTLASWFRSMPRSLAKFCAIVLSCASFLP